MSDENYSVGYGKPPKNRQWKKGQSGNPNGRPKASSIPPLNLQDGIIKEMSEYMAVKVDGSPMVHRKFELFIKSIIAKALKGDMRAAKFLEKYIPAKGSEAMAPQMIINPSGGCTNENCPDFNPDNVMPPVPPIYGEDDDES